jgi:hypothetical protein
VNIGSGTQPYALLISIVIVIYDLFNKCKSNKKLFFLFLIFILSTIIALINLFLNGFDLTILRSLANYYSLFFITYAVFFSLIYNRGFNENILKTVIIIWFSVAFVQEYIDSTFMKFLNPRGISLGAGGGRGVVSLATEPTFYGIICIFLLLLTIEIIKSNRNLYVLLLLIQIIFFAKSSMSILFLFILISIYLSIIFIKSKFKFYQKIFILFSVLISFMIFVFILNNYLDNTRIYKLYKTILEDPFLLFTSDASANDRLSHIYFSIKGFFEHYFMPHGYLYWRNYLYNSLKYQDFFYWVSVGDRIMSGYGAAFFELGFFGLSIPFIISSIIKDYKKPVFEVKLTYILFMNIILIAAIPLANPYLAFILGYFLYYNYDFIYLDSEGNEIHQNKFN